MSVLWSAGGVLVLVLAVYLHARFVLGQCCTRHACAKLGSIVSRGKPHGVVLFHEMEDIIVAHVGGYQERMTD